jgi:hypothetical protein
MIDDFKADILLDKYRLDEDAVNQAGLFLKWGEQWALAVQTRDTASKRIKEVEADCDREIRETPGKFGWVQPSKEPTEKFIEAKIPNHPKYIEAKNALIEAEFQVNLLSIVKQAFSQRDSMITALAGLYKGGYFSTSTPERFENIMTDRAHAAQTEGLRKNERLRKRFDIKEE